MAFVGVRVITVLTLVGLPLVLSQGNSSSLSLRGSAPARLLECSTASCQGDFLPDKELTKFAFHYMGGQRFIKSGKADAYKRIDDVWTHLQGAVRDACIADINEFAMFMANIAQESDFLKTTEEYSDNYNDGSYNWGECEVASTNLKCKDKACPDGKTPSCDACAGADCKGTRKCKAHYHGRGYLQTSWDYNYQDAMINGKCGNKATKNIVNNPELVADDTEIAWCTTAHYWKKSVHLDRCQDGCAMGSTIAAINGAKECAIQQDGTALSSAEATHGEEAQNRFCFYAWFYAAYTKKRYLPFDKADQVCLTDLDGKCSGSVRQGR